VSDEPTSCCQSPFVRGDGTPAVHERRLDDHVFVSQTDESEQPFKR
jgi:hypothetical protein